jgi:phage-related protein
MTTTAVKYTTAVSILSYKLLLRLLARVKNLANPVISLFLTIYKPVADTFYTLSAQMVDTIRTYLGTVDVYGLSVRVWQESLKVWARVGGLVMHALEEAKGVVPKALELVRDAVGVALGTMKGAEGSFKGKDMVKEKVM